jgi:glycosyltransferase involved in cell wall biosynthesis
MPVYNAARHLEATVASVLAQSFAGFELIAIDDGSQDNSLALLLEMAARDPRIKVIARANGGVASARNLGVESAAAPLIAFLDADDLWEPTAGFPSGGAPR